MRGTDHARPCRIPRARPKPSRHATPNAHPQTARAQHPAAHRATTGKSYGNALPREAPRTSSQGAATQSNTTTRPRRSKEDPTQTSENRTAHKFIHGNFLSFFWPRFSLFLLMINGFRCVRVTSEKSEHSRATLLQTV